MPTPRLTDEQLIKTANAYRQLGSNGHTLLDIARSTYQNRCKQAEERGFLTKGDSPQTTQSKGMTIEQEPPLADLTTEEIIDAKKEIARRKIAAANYQNLIDVNISTHGPIGLIVFGDPHVDDDSCDIERLESDLDIACKTEAMFCGHLGDITNNWVGRLQFKYADQVATRAHAKKLINWVLKDRPNMFVVSGNHDLWNDGQNLIDFALQDQMVVAGPHGIRMRLNFPSGDPIRIHARHDFPGNSIYNASHALRRELAFGLRDHILLAGHRHIDAYAMHAHAEDPFISHLFRVSGYKMVDDYADANRFMPTRFAPSVTLILDPEANPVDKVKPFWDTHAGADYLKFLRKRRTSKR
jgi:hypothetical protein